MDENKLIPIPLWVLKHKVETDFEEYMFFCSHKDPDDVKSPTFPMYDSTIQVLGVLKDNGVEFDTKTGLWKDQR